MSTKKKDWRSKDPDHAAEKARYANPLPSRRLILDILRDAPGPLPAREVAERIGLGDSDPYEAFVTRLEAMVRDGQLARTRRGAYGVAQEMSLLSGTVIAHRDGYGFMTPDEGGEDVFMPPPEMKQLWSGDRVQVRVTRTDARGRREGVLVEVLDRGIRSVVGRYVVEHGAAYVVPENPKLHHDVLIPPQDAGSANAGQMVVAEITVHPLRRALPVGRVVEVLGEHLAPGMEIEAAIRAHGLPFVWPPDVEAEAARIPQAVTAAQRRGRQDMRELPLVTIDGADARDFDDAVHCQPARGGWRLWVAIADVDSYVAEGSALDREAADRGNSVYFPQRVIPMLPEALSNGVCSLNPDVERLCMVCEMRISRDGEVTGARFHEGVMRSYARFTYEQVYEILEQPQGALARQHAALIPHLQALDAVYHALQAARQARGALDLETVETKIVFGSERKIERIVPVRRNRAHLIIEECMIAANVQAARFVLKQKLPSLFRVHATPDADKVAALREYLGGRGLGLGGGAEPRPADFAQVAKLARQRPDVTVIHGMLLRAMMQARYSPECSGHFGLALDEYAHFTSPIRRYPDLVLHRTIRHILRGGRRSQHPYTIEQLDALGAHCSMTERRADEAVRDVEQWLKCEYMRHHIGDSFEAIVTGVAAFGLFVLLEDLYVEGMVHISTLQNDYYEHDASHQRLVGRRSGCVYGLGDRLRVRVVRVSLDDRKIDLEAVAPVQDKLSAKGENQGGRAARGRRRGRKPRSES